MLPVGNNPPTFCGKKFQCLTFFTFCWANSRASGLTKARLRGVDSPEKKAINSDFSSTHLFLRNAEVPKPKDQGLRNTIISLELPGIGGLGPFSEGNKESIHSRFWVSFHLLVFVKTTVDFQKLQSLNLIKFRFRSTSWLLEVSYFTNNKIEDYPTSGNLEGLKSKPSRSMATSTNPTQICGTGKHELGSCLVSLGCKVHLFVAWMLQKTSLWIFMVQ